MKTTALITILLLSGCTHHLFNQATLGVSIVSGGGQELIVNGSFESPSINPGTWQVLSAIDGWRTSFGPGIEIQNNVAGTPFAGKQHVELDSDASSGMYQDVPTMGEAVYCLRLASVARPGTDLSNNALELVWNGVVLDELSLRAYDWKVFSYEVRGAKEKSRIEIRDASPSDSLGAYVDSVSLRLKGEASCQ